MNKTISIVIPIYNEEYILRELINKLGSSVRELPFSFELVFINDGSCDNSLNILLDISNEDRRVRIIDLSRNFGHQQAISAGIDHVDSDAVILMDADMEDDPEDLPLLINKWQEGYDVVYAVRKSRKVSVLKNACFHLFHSLNKFFSDVPVENAGIFGIMDRKVINEIKRLKEKSRYIPGLRSWVGFKQTSVVLERGKRYDAKSRVHFSKLINLACNSYFGFSKKPIRLASFFGFLFSFVSFIAALFVVIFQLVFRFRVSGWASLATILLFVSSMQFICIGVMGEYIGRIFDEVKDRPLYVVRGVYGKK